MSAEKEVHHGAVARRHLRRRMLWDRDYAWHFEAPTLSPGHHDRQEVIFATSVANTARASALELGRGNFGVAYLAETDAGRFVVKCPTEIDIHGRTWTAKEQRENFLHEAGVANELASLGVRIVPHIVFVELEDGSPALVREYGEPVLKSTPEVYADVEKALVDVEARGWKVEDEIELFTRPDGSLFVGDVGIWHPAVVEDGAERFPKFSTLDMLLRILAHRLIDEFEFPALSEVLRRTQHCEHILQRIRGGHALGEYLFLLREAHRFFARAQEQRERIGLPTPKEALEMADTLCAMLAKT